MGLTRLPVSPGRAPGPGPCRSMSPTSPRAAAPSPTIRVALAAIATAYRLAGLALDLRDPKLARVVEGVTRTLGLRPRRQATPAVPELLRAMLVQCRRDEMFRAALAARPRHAAARFWRGVAALGTGGADFGDAEIVSGRGVRLLVRRSKTDQQGRGGVAIWADPAEPAFCPRVALEKWLVFRKLGVDFAGDDGGQIPVASRCFAP